MSKVRTTSLNSISAARITGTLHRLAANEALDTKVAIRKAIREEGLPGRDEFVVAVLNMREEHETQRNNRQKRRNIARTGKARPATAMGTSQQSVALPAGTPNSRLAEYRRQQVREVAFSLFRSGAAGGTSFEVKVTDDHEEVGYRVCIWSNRHTYGGRFKGWTAKEDHHVVTLSSHWMTRILRCNLASLDGLMTLDAREVASGTPDVELYKAIWARQGKGYSVITEHGLIARHGEMTHHADTAAKALSGLRRKLAQVGQHRRTVQYALDIDVTSFIKRYRRHDCMVSLDDARSSGSCEAGILNWCERVGIDPKRGAVPLSEALEAFSRSPLVEVRLAVMQAVQRHRREQRLAA